MADFAKFEFRVTGADETKRAFDRLARESPARARKAVNRTLGVARQRVIKSVSAQTGIPRRVLGGRKGRFNKRTGVRVAGRGYIKHIRATRRRQAGALVGLVAGVLFSALGRQSLGRSRPEPGGAGRPFRVTMRSGNVSLFERIPPLTKVSRGSSPRTKRKNLPIRELRIPIRQETERAMRIILRRAARTVYPAKLWEELRKSIKPVR